MTSPLQRFFAARGEQAIGRMMLLYPAPAFFSILCGEAALAAFHLKWIPSGAFLPVVWVMLVAFGVYWAAHLLMTARQVRLRMRMPGWITDRYVLMQAAIFLLAMDFWAWGISRPFLFGVPLWVAYFVLLSALQTAAMAGMIRKYRVPREGRRSTRGLFF